MGAPGEGPRELLLAPARRTWGLLFLFIPFIVNAVMLWLTDRLLKDLGIKGLRALLGSAAVITVVNWLFNAAVHALR